MFLLELDLQFFSGEKTEKATPQKRQETRKKGQVAKSAEIPAAIIIIGIVLFLKYFGGWMGEKLLTIFHITFTKYLNWDINIKSIEMLFEQFVWDGFKILLPIMLIAFVLGILGNYLQVGFMFVSEPLKPKLERINPIQGAKRIFSMQSLVAFIKSILKIVIIAYCVFQVLWKEKDELLLISQKGLGHAINFITSITLEMALVTGIALFVLAVLDYMYQKFSFEKSIRMSKQEIKDEFKKTEGDPQIKSKIKERQRQMSMNRMIQELPKADVLITNPTHYAVAIQYDAETMEAPIVIAMGKDHVALKLREKAKELDIVIMENKPLARALYESVEIGDPIPEELFLAVAEVLAYVYRLKGKIS